MMSEGILSLGDTQDALDGALASSINQMIGGSHRGYQSQDEYFSQASLTDVGGGKQGLELVISPNCPVYNLNILTPVLVEWKSSYNVHSVTFRNPHDVELTIIMQISNTLWIREWNVTEDKYHGIELNYIFLDNRIPNLGRIRTPGSVVFQSNPNQRFSPVVISKGGIIEADRVIFSFPGIKNPSRITANPKIQAQDVDICLSDLPSGLTPSSIPGLALPNIFPGIFGKSNRLSIRNLFITTSVQRYALTQSAHWHSEYVPQVGKKLGTTKDGWNVFE